MNYFIYSTLQLAFALYKIEQQIPRACQEINLKNNTCVLNTENPQNHYVIVRHEVILFPRYLLLDFRGTMDKFMIPKFEVWIFDQLDESNK